VGNSVRTAENRPGRDPRSKSRASPSRPSRTLDGAGTRMVKLSVIRFLARTDRNPVRRTSARASSVDTTPKLRWPRPTRYSATACPTFSWKSRPAYPTGVGVRSHTSTTGIFAATRRRWLSTECEMPVREYLPSGAY